MTGRSAPPTPPTPPDPADCCGEGCVHCVFDVYEAQLARYRTTLEQWRQGEHEGPAAPAPPKS